VREEKTTALADAVHRLTLMPARNLGLHDRGELKVGYFADLVIFDPATIADHAEYAAPRQFSTGVSEVIVNGKLVLAGGEPTGAAAGQVVRGRGWTGWFDGGCRGGSVRHGKRRSFANTHRPGQRGVVHALQPLRVRGGVV
jgi:N-acyl-D-amino-acid deacylase